ncbi:MAG: hypothetical protein AAFX79_06385 [Planctomycetota bacterium]
MSRTLVMEWHNGWLTAAAVSGGRGGPVVHGVACERVRDGVPQQDARAVGEWAAGVLRDAGLRGGRVTWLAGRGEVLLKRLTLPRPPSEAQLPSMVRLQMARAMPVQGTDAAVDYAPLEERDADLVLLGAAMPADRLAWTREMLAAAGLKLGGVRLRAQAAAALAGVDASATDGSACIVVAPGAAAIEVVVVEGGGVVASRGVDATWPAGDATAFAHRIAVDVKRAWMGYRAGAASRAVGSAVVLGAGPVCEAIADAVGEQIEADARVVCPEGLPGGGGDPSRWVPLLGVAAGDGSAAIDLASPRKGPDTSSKIRERALLGVLAAAAVFGTAGVFGYLSLADLADEKAALQARARSLQADFDQLAVRRAQLRHLEALRLSDPEWLAHLDHLGGLVLDGGIRVDDLGGVSRGEAWFGNPRGGARRFSFNDGEYRPRVRGVITVQGEAASRATATLARGRIVEDGTYEVETQGPDAGTSFGLSLATGRRTPPEAQPADETQPATDSEADGGGP